MDKIDSCVLLVEMKNDAATMADSIVIPKNLNIKLSYDSAISFLK